MLKKVKKLFTDTLQTRGKWSIKRMAGISGFYFAVLYVFIPFWAESFHPQEWAFWGLITFGASAIGMTVWNKKIDKNNPEE